MQIFEHLDVDKSEIPITRSLSHVVLRFSKNWKERGQVNTCSFLHYKKVRYLVFLCIYSHMLIFIVYLFIYCLGHYNEEVLLFGETNRKEGKSC